MTDWASCNARLLAPNSMTGNSASAGST
jgi:hypothetical protein